MAAHVHLKLSGGNAPPSDPQVDADVKTMNLWPVHALSDASECVCQFIAGPQHADIITQTERLVAAHGLKPKATRSAVRTLLWALSGATKYSLAAAHLKEDLVGLGVDIERASAVSAVWERAGPRLGQLAADKLVQAGNLLDAEWRFGVTVSTDDISRVGSTFLQMKLTVADDNAAGGLKAEHLEMTIPQFYDLLAQLEKAQSYVSYLGQTG